ncbi:GNAT family N-acetyltransferase [Streptomyces sp. NPDC057582]|uniref:GNAT family N-acetyltransferase n=1 Tax=Streptomyces sp. NPDC057582 TaxID=3346174 RepID=UPI0036B682AB
MSAQVSLSFRQHTLPHDVDAALQQQLTRCWIEVSDAGGAVGFPFPPVDSDEVAAATAGIVAALDADSSRLLTAWAGSELVGWLNVRRDTHPLVAHWGTLHHVQTRVCVRGRGVGAALMNRVREIARDEMGLEQLHLAARGGVGLEDFYGRLGWKEIGRWPGALRLGSGSGGSGGDDRDEVLMLLSPL